MTDPHFVVKDKASKPLAAHEWGEGHAIDHGQALQYALSWIEKNIPGIEITAVGHRIVRPAVRD